MLDYKDNYLLKLLVNSNYNLTITDIQKLLGVSQRSVYYSIDKINDFLQQNNLPILVNERQKGIVVDPVIRHNFTQDIIQSISEMYVFTPQERVALEIIIITCEEGSVNIPYLEQIFDVSRNTIINDLKEIRTELSTFNLALEYDTKVGYLISGVEIQKRSVLLNLVSQYDYLLKMKIYPLYSEQRYKEIHHIIHKLEQELNIKYVESSLENLSILLAIISEHKLPFITLRDEDRTQIESTKEYHAVKRYFDGVIAPEEYVYIAIHLLGLRVHVADEDMAFEDEYIREIVEFIIDEFSKITLIYFDDEELFTNLYYHMKQTMYRLKYGIIFQNKLKDQIFESYPQVSQVTKTVCKKLEHKIGYPINDEDVGFIAMHFGGSLKRKQREIKQITVLLVCLNGVATSKLLRKEIEYMFNNVEIIDAISLDDITTWKDEVDYIVSTIPIQEPMIQEKVILVNGILTDLDKEKLIHAFQSHQSLYNQALSSKIFNAIKDYIPSTKQDVVKNIIDKQFTDMIKASKPLIERMDRPMLKDVLTKDKILFASSVDTWEDAIWLSAKPLLDTNAIEKRYVAKVIANVHDLGPYIGIAPDIAISHARPEDGVHQLGLTMLIMNEPVYLNNQENKPVRVMITLASPDNEKHLTALQQLSQLLMSNLDELLQATTADEVLALVEQYS